MFHRICFWEPQVSPHKSEFFSAIARAAPHIEIICFAASELSAHRRSLGWSANGTGFRTICSPSELEIQSAISDKISTTLHVFSGFRWIEMLERGISLVQRSGSRYLILSEPRVGEGLIGRFRYIHSLATERALRKSVSAVLAIGAHGPRWFEKVGYSKERIFPFAYFVDPPKLELIRTDAGASPKVIYLGRLVREKGVLTLAQAMTRQQRLSQFTIVGDGPQRGEMQSILDNSQTPARFLGSVPRENVGSLLSEHDVLILPSLTSDDGWGVAVSEALMAGVIVVVSSAVGSSIVVRHNFVGRIVRPGSAVDICNALDDIVSQGLLDNPHRRMRLRWARSVLSATAGAKYFLSILDHIFKSSVRPEPFYSGGYVDAPTG